MELKWSTEVQDMLFAHLVIEKYSARHDVHTFELFELFIDKSAKKMEFVLAKWVVELAYHFYMQYGSEKGDFVLRQVVSRYMTLGEVRH